MQCQAEPRREKSRSGDQDLIRAAQLRVLRSQLPELVHRLPCGSSGLRRERRVRLVAPAPQRLRGNPRPFAAAAIAFVSDEYGERDSASSLTAFALNSPVYLVPFVMVPSSPIESGEMRNKNQFISPKHLTM